MDSVTNPREIAMNKLSDYLKPESMLTGNFVGGSIAGIGAAFATVFPTWNNGYVVLIAAALFGILMASQAIDAKRGKIIFIVYLLLGTGLGMWEAVQSGTFIESRVVKVSASTKARVYIDEDGLYVASKITEQGREEYRVPRWAARMYASYLDLEDESRKRQSPWKLKF